jgi:hypothetical protein
VLISAPQKGWSASPCARMVMLGERARARIDGTTSTSFACDLKKWLQIMEAYEGGGHAYHATMPTDGLRRLRDVMRKPKASASNGARASGSSNSAPGARAAGPTRLSQRRRGGLPGPGRGGQLHHGRRHPVGEEVRRAGLQIAAGVPLQCDEPADFSSFRIGLFGLDKLADSRRHSGGLDTPGIPLRGGRGRNSAAGRFRHRSASADFSGFVIPAALHALDSASRGGKAGIQACKPAPGLAPAGDLLSCSRKKVPKEACPVRVKHIGNRLVQGHGLHF